MSNNDAIERMRQLIEAKKTKSGTQRGLVKPDKAIETTKIAQKQYKKQGGLFDGR